MTRVTYVRSGEMPRNALFQYEIRDDVVIITVSMDAAHENVVRAAEEMWNEILSEHMTPRCRLRLVSGRGG